MLVNHELAVTVEFVYVNRLDYLLMGVLAGGTDRCFGHVLAKVTLRENVTSHLRFFRQRWRSLP